MSEPKSAFTLDVPVPAVGRGVPEKIRDEREAFAAISREAGRDEVAARAFVLSKAHILRTDPRLRGADRAAAVADLTERLGVRSLEDLETESTPVPGGVGYGVNYSPPFDHAFGQGTSLFYEVICPTVPGGNVNTYLFLTAMNRAGKGIEVLVSYNAQAEAHLKVYDWSLHFWDPPDPWRLDVGFSSLGHYLATVSYHGRPYQVLGILNVSYQLSPGQWRNEAWLWNRYSGFLDLIYRHDYPATRDEQLFTEEMGTLLGSFGPIVETFQPHYHYTYAMGALGITLNSKDMNGVWGPPWQLLTSSDSSIRTDNKGFDLILLEPNYAFVVDSLSPVVVG
jgi:hypothetical protein